ncbi:c-type cytochrome [Beijerinckia mobilis]|uniref:c-type cytochrome n=1 Tax=Beijerinckia mobilis TaxID=231434 RepID=UPI00054E6722|nr:cytochrome c family protein [Beijerinckia mobilis]
MSSFEFNKYAGAFFGSLLFAMALVTASDLIFEHPPLAKPGYDLPGATEGGGESGGGEATPAVAPLPERLAKADIKKGEADTKPCQACHTFDKGGGAKVGPPLWGIVDRPKASVAGFAYSDATKAKGGNWTLEDLDVFITSPKTFISGTKMAFGGEKDPQKRADLIDYLNTLSDSPKPLPTK